MAIPAGGCFNQLPEIITTNLRESTLFTDIFNTGNKHPCGSAVVTDNLCLKWHGLDDLVGIFFAVITVCAVPREDEPVAHGR
jgi:hypothetical protein